ncbi:MAG: prepilin peptidase [Bacteriovorax sp.]|nr:prepilin peptidase [Bacteriovorax sp.]
MMPMMVFIFLSIQLLVVAYVDFKTRKISNVWLLINFAFFSLLTIVYPKLYVWSFSVMLFPVAFLLVGFALFALNIMGGGDSKYLSSLYLLIPFEFQDMVFLYLLYTTVIVGSSLLLFNALKNFDKIVLLVRIGDVKGIRKIFGKKFTYAPVIFIAWMWFGWQNHSILGY